MIQRGLRRMTFARELWMLVRILQVVIEHLAGIAAAKSEWEADYERALGLAELGQYDD